VRQLVLHTLKQRRLGSVELLQAGARAGQWRQEGDDTYCSSLISALRVHC
jgi:hypothetical protein